MSSDQRPRLRIERPDEGVLFVVTGPSGVGKSTIVREALRRIPDVSFSVSATTRPPRVGEVDGVDYHFVDAERFAALLDADAFIEHATVYDRSYGTLREPVRAALGEGRSILLDIDVRGARQVRTQWPGAVFVFLVPPSWTELEARLRQRGTDSDEVIARRMELAAEQVRGCVEFDFLVVNDDLDTAWATFEGILLAEMTRRSRRSSLVERVLGVFDPR